MTYVLEKDLWTEADFEVMGWHDATFHAVAIHAEDYRLFFDLDYIFQWNAPVPPAPDFTFWIAPVTLVFEGVQDPSFNMSFIMIGTFQLQDLHRSDPKPTLDPRLTDWAWKLDLNEGEITFRAYGFRQFVRRAPIHTESQSLSIQERGGFGFGFQESLLPPHREAEAS